MARLAQLKATMIVTILITLLIFAAFIMVISYIFVLAAQTNTPFYIVLTVSLVIALLFILLEYAISPAIIAFSTRLQYLKPGENQWLENLVKELSEKSQVPMPRLAVVPNSSPNAFVFGHTAKSSTLAVHQGLLEQLNQTEVRGVIAHELGHIKHRDSIVMTMLSAIPLIAYIIARTSLGVKTDRGKNAGIVIAIAFISLLIYLITYLLVLMLSRLREHFADSFSGYLTNSPRSLESALTKITYGLSLRPEDPHGARSLYIADPALAKLEFSEIVEKKEEYDLDKDGVLDEHELELAMEKEAKSTWKNINSWFSTHPPTYKRILLLRQIEEELKRGTYTIKGS